jgi:hypothetical protein
MRQYFIGFVAVTLFALPGTMLGSGCTGNACSVVSRADSGGCIIFVNNSNKAVHIKLGGMSTNIAGHGRWKVTNIDGKTCIGAAVGDLEINYL